MERSGEPGLRIQEALSLSERDLDPQRGSLLARNGKGGRRREIGDGCLELAAASALAHSARRTAGRADGLRDRQADARQAVVKCRGCGASFGASLLRPGVRRRFAPHQLRHAHAVELARERVPLNSIQRQLGHVNLGTTSVYLKGIDTEESITAVNSRGAPMMPASAGLQFQTSQRKGEPTGLPLRPGRYSNAPSIVETPPLVQRESQIGDRRG